MILATNWGTAWLMTGMGFGVVFLILILLVIILSIFSSVFVKPAKAADTKPAAMAQMAQPIANASEDDKAAVAVALYLYLNNQHDEESGKLTIVPTPNAGWHSVLNTRL